MAKIDSHNYMPKKTRTFERFIECHREVIADYSIEADGVFISVTEASGLEDCYGSRTVRGDNATEAMKKFRENFKRKSE